MPGARATRLPALAGSVASGSTLESETVGDSFVSGGLSSAMCSPYRAGRDSRRGLAQDVLVDLGVGADDVLEGEVPRYVRSAAASHQLAFVRRGQQSQHRRGETARVLWRNEKPIPAVSDDLLASRSEEHTSELQSQSNLVCRLLLEKKKK